MRAYSQIGMFVLLGTVVASAAPLTWTVTGVFDDGGSLSGSFTYDADTGSISNFNVTTTAGSTLSGYNYTPSDSSAFYNATEAPVCTANCFEFSRNDNQLYLLLEFPTPLTDGGGTVNFVLGTNNPNASYECTNCGTGRFLTSGSATAPVPQTLTFDSIPNQLFGVPPFPLAAQSNQLLPVTFSSTTPTVCKVAGDLVQMVSTGPCSITANQAGNASYQSASASQGFTISQATVSGTLMSAANSPFQVGTSPNSVAVADFNGDGKPDLAIANYGANSGGPGSSVTVLLGDGSGNFTQASNSPILVPTGQNGNSYSLAAGDFNADGRPDIAVAAVYSDNVTVLLGNGDGTFTEASGSPFAVGSHPQQPFFVTVGDFNNDGIQDLVTANAASNTVTVLLGNGTGGFTPAPNSPFPVGNTPESVAVGDFDGNGTEDLAVANVNSNNVTVLLGNGSGGFSAASGSPISVGTNPFSVAVADFDSNGKLDLATANYGGNVTVLMGNGSGGFTQHSGSPFSAGGAVSFVAAADFNGDGIPDLTLSNGTVLLGDGAGGFTQAGNFFSGSPLAVADLNKDGIEDIAGVNSGSGTVTVLLGNLSATNSTLGTSSPPTILVGTNVNLSLSVSGTGFNPISGTATFFDGSTNLGDGMESGNNYSFTASGLTRGNHIFKALYNGGGGYQSSSSNTITIDVQQTQTITFNAPANVTLPQSPFSIAADASASSGLSVQFSSNSMSVCSVNASGVLAVLTIGTCSITANQPGDGVNYAAAMAVTRTFLVLGEPQTISFAPLSNAYLGAQPITINATASSALPVSLASNSPTICSVNGATASVLAVGTCSITATQTGSTTYAAATPVTQTFNISIPPLTISIAPTSVSTIVGGSVSASFSANGGSPPYSYSASGLPSGVTLSSGSFTGSPTQAGTFNVSVTVTDSKSVSNYTSVTLNVLGLTTTALANGTAGVFYAVSLSAGGGTDGYTFSASGLPQGMSLTSYGYLTGTVTTAGAYPISVSVSSGGLTATQSLTLTIAKPQPLSVSGAALQSGPVNVQYSQSFTASGGIAPYTWSLTSSAPTAAPPPGLSLSTSGTVSGTPTTPGAYSFGVMVTDTAGATATATASITIQPAPLTFPTTQSLPSGMFGVDFPQQQLTVSGGVAPYNWAIASGSLPSGMTLTSDGVLSGTPQSTPASSARKGLVAHDATSSADTTYPFGLTVTDSANTQSTTSISLDIRQPGANLILTAATLTFSLATPATSLPPPQVVGVQSTVSSDQLTYTLSMNPAVPWLSITNGTTTPDSIQASLTQAALNLAAGAYQTILTATCSSSSCSGSTETVTVNLNVIATPPKLQIQTSLISFATTNISGGTLNQPINLSNAGGGSLGFASVSCEAPWCGVGPPSSSLAGGVSAALPVTVDPTGLGPGFYRTQVDIVTSAGRGTVAVTLFISASASMTLAPAGAQFNMLAGGAPGNSTGSFLVAVNGSSISWNAAIVSLPNFPAPTWLVVGTSSGSSTATQPGSVSFSIDPTAASALAPGAYYGAIEVSSPDVSNSPEDFEVVLNVAPANTPVVPDPQPGGLLFITSAGGVLPPETITVYSASASNATFQASATTLTGGSWLSVSPTTGAASATSPGTTLVSVDISKLTPGVYQGGVSYSLSATAVRTVNVTLIVTGSGQSTTSALSQKSSPHAAGCTASRLVPAQTGLVNSFSQPAGWPTPIQIVLSDDCGAFVTNGQLVATFSNGDPPLALPVVNSPQGLYSATWAPAHASSQISIDVTANAPGFPAAISQISGSVIPNEVPVITPNGTVHSFDPLVGGALAPGTIIAIYGQNLAASASQPTMIPLPTIYNGTSALIGGIPAPLYYISPTQVNAQIPFELLPGSRYDVLVSANGALTNPQPIQLSPATPGLAAFSDGTLIAQHTDGSLVSQTSPASGGEYLVSYLAGLGDTGVPVSSGAASPSSPLAEPQNALTLTINGSTYPTAFVGLTPGLVGLYQMNFQVPGGLPAGNLTITVSQNGVSSNQTVLPYQP